MAITYSLAINPKWYIADQVGRPLAGGYLATFSNLNPTQRKLVYQDIQGTQSWPYVAIPNKTITGILFDENGSQGPFYWQFDTANPDELYYIEVYDSNGVLIWTVDNFSPAGNGGGSVITTAVDLENLVINNVMYRNFGASPNPIASTSFTVAPGANAGLALTSSLAGPDIVFAKNNLNAIDQLQFLPFAVGSTPLTKDVTPEQYLNYVCGNSPSGETFKYVQFPITSGVKNLENQAVTVTIWARSNSGTTTLTLQWFQFFGDGSSASIVVPPTIQALTVTAGWNKFRISANVPSIAGKTIGECGNSGLFIRVQYPLGVPCDIDFTKLSMYLGNVAPNQDYHSYDMIDGEMDTARTGDIRTSINDNYYFGWVPMNDGTIGSTSSNATNRANVDTFPLYNMIWNKMQSNSAYAPVYTSSGAPATYGATAIADFEADKQLSLTKSLAKVFAGQSSLIPAAQTFTADHTTGILTVTNAVQYGTGSGVAIFTTGGGVLPSGLQTGVVYYAIYVSATTMKLASSIANALSGAAISFGSDGTATLKIILHNIAVGTFVGEETHTLIKSELPDPLTTTAGNSNAPNTPTVFEAVASTGGYGTGTVSNQGGNQPHNIMQPTTYMNVFIKL